MKQIVIAAAIGLLPFATTATAQEEASPETVEAIMAMLAEMQCEMDEGDIEPMEGGGYELDDVFCADGQYDMELDADLAVTDRRKE